MVEVFPLAQSGLVAESLEVEQIVGRTKFSIPIQDAEKWFKGVYCIHPDTLQHMDTANMRVKWVGKDIPSWVCIRKVCGKLYITTLMYDLIARFPNASY